MVAFTVELLEEEAGAVALVEAVALAEDSDAAGVAAASPAGSSLSMFI